MKKIFLFFTIVAFTNSIYSQKNRAPKGCDNITPLKELYPSIIADATTAKNFIMDPNNENYGSLSERIAALKKETEVSINRFKAERAKEYARIQCQFYKKIKKRSGDRFRKITYFTIENKYEFIQSTLKHNTNGDMKKWPSIEGNKITWTIGAESGKASGYVDIQVKYTSKYIKEVINKEITKIKLELNKKNIPTE